MLKKSPPRRSDTLSKKKRLAKITGRLSRRKKIAKEPPGASESSASGAGGNTQSLTRGGDTAYAKLLAEIVAETDKAHAEWDQATPAWKEARILEIFPEGVPWKGEVAYDDEADIEYEEDSWRKYQALVGKSN